METRKIKCKNCNKEFITPVNKTGGSINFFCSIPCAEEYDNNNPKYVKCKNCGKDIRVHLKGLSRFYTTASYCCIDCSKEYIKSHPVVKNAKGETKQICEKCNCEFYSKYKRKYCLDCEPKTPKYSICLTCGKQFENKKNKEGYYYTSSKYCSTECMQKACCIRINKKLICQKCGKEFDMPKNCQGWRYEVKYCPECTFKPIPQYSICSWCGKSFENKIDPQTGRRTKKAKYCSDECRKLGQNSNLLKTLQTKYGKEVKHVMEIPGSFDKFKATMQEKYGIDYACQLKECIEANKHTISQINKSFAQNLKELNINYTVEYNLQGMFYDFYLPECNTLIEINPTYTHTYIGNHYNNFCYNEKMINYHINKTQLATENSYHCIHVWQWDSWKKIVDIIKPKQKLYARKLQLKEVTKQDANQFLNNYHLQNSCYGNTINLGLYQGEQLIQVMTFGKPRYNKNYQWELLRLCTHSDYYVVGGAEKLFKYFIKTYAPKSVISYCDVSKFTGDVYLRFGFKLKEQTKPQKIWSKYDFENKEYVTDNLLRQQGYDRLFNANYGKGTNNEELMIKHKWLPIYDCGQKVYIWMENYNDTNKKENTSNEQ